ARELHPCPTRRSSDLAAWSWTTPSIAIVMRNWSMRRQRRVHRCRYTSAFVFFSGEILGHVQRCADSRFSTTVRPAALVDGAAHGRADRLADVEAAQPLARGGAHQPEPLFSRTA